MRKLYCTAILSLLLFGYSYGQQAPVYSQYILNEFLINPAVAGIDGMTSITISGRKQWLGLSYTPETYSASISTRILKSPLSVNEGKIRKSTKGRVGIGAAFVSDKYGAINRTSVQFTYAYHLFIQNYQLSFGLRILGTQLNIDPDLISFRDEDPLLESMLGESSFIPDAGFGLNFSTQNLHIGLSVNELLESRINFGDAILDNAQLRYVRNYTFHGYYRTPLRQNRDWTFEPSWIIRGNEKAHFSGDLTARFVYKKEYWIGTSIRTSGELILFAGLKWNRALLGYSFDYGFNQLSYNSYGSHEIMIAFKLGDSIRRYRWLERY
ncbi:MAG: type IX secretion system membrane protein PorP/SprF [Bacteroidales bacterium]|nr:type IX secretion system membrane protein PorP/SprF [Bacteroidales bacterium]